MQEEGRWTQDKDLGRCAEGLLLGQIKAMVFIVNSEGSPSSCTDISPFPKIDFVGFPHISVLATAIYIYSLRRGFKSMWESLSS